MDKTREEKFHRLFEQMIDEMTDPDRFERDRFIGALREFAVHFHLTKGVTEFYKNADDEKAGDGEILCDFSDGPTDVVVLKRRINAKSGAIIIGTLYTSKEEAKLPPEELEQLDLTLRALLSFVSLNRLQVALERFAFHDEAGYPNIRSFFRHLGQVMAQGKLHDYAAICFNLRHFSLINQDIGRERGDVAMQNYIDLLSIASGDATMVCRMGGDNFLMTVRAQLLNDVLDILSGALVTYDDEGAKRVQITASAGVFRIPEDYIPEHPGAILERIYASMQVAKQNEDMNIIFYDDHMANMKKHMVRTHQRFFRAMERGDIHAFFQPKVDVFTGRVVGAEALCRWINGSKIVSPGDFIPVLEQNTDICKLDFHILDLVCQHIRRWMDEGRRVVRVSVNLSRKHLSDADLLPHLMSIVDKNRVPHEYIEIELTETTTDVAFRDLRGVVTGLHREGISTSVDDFGMGYSSLNLIREIPWNVLKIDRCFLPTDEEEESSTTSIMYRNVIAMARELGLECVTEGVETLRQVEILKENNCRIAQGYFYDKPLPVEEFEKKIDHIYTKE